ncbi:MAG TPA: hypothetical protein VID27_09070 [Blastocatellia bacterium]|jgi:hypothetical protein
MKMINRFAIRMTVLIFFISLFSVAAAANSPADEKEKSTSSSEKAADRAADANQAEPVNISYVAFVGAMKIERAPETKPVEPAPAAPAPQRISTAPMSVGDKFNYFVHAAFYPPGPYATAIANGLFKEALDNNEGKKDTFGDYLADSMTRAARSFASGTTSKFFERFLYASLFRQDPRYHRSYKEGAGARIGYALSRIVITRGDRGGSQFNASYLLGGATSAAISNVWEREENQTVKKSFSRWGNHIAITALTNILKEFLSGQ